MARDLCASCKQQVEDGSVVCSNCGVKLDLPGAFTQVLGWVIVAGSSIPFAISEVTTAEKNLVPLIFAVCVLLVGVVLVATGRVRARAAEATTIPDSGMAAPPASYSGKSQK